MNKKNENIDALLSINDDNSKFQQNNLNSHININNPENQDENDIKQSKEINKQINQISTNGIKNQGLLKKSEKIDKKIEQVESANNSSQTNINFYNSSNDKNENIDFKEQNNNILNKNNNDQDEIKNEFIQFSNKSSSPTLLNNNSDKNGSSIILENNDNDIILEKVTFDQDIKLKYNTFCESFFLTSFSKNKGKIMNNFNGLQADCNHFFCSLLPAMEPEILYKYPNEDIRGLEVNNLAASICFPNGIKLCYKDNEESIKTVENYRSSFTNQVGERFFAVVYHFYLKMNIDDFENSYQLTPIKYQINISQDENKTSLKDGAYENDINDINHIKEKNMSNYVYIPYCLCLISRYPYIQQMEKCLESIMISINNKNGNNTDYLNKVITYIVKSIPAPPYNAKILFPLLYDNKYVEIKQPYFKDIIEFGDNPLIILNLLSIQNILYLFKLLVFEQNLVIVGNNNDIISQIILNLASLLYPFEWVHTFIPVMSNKMLKFLQSFLPFFTGINITLFPKAIPLLEKAEKVVFIFDIDNNKFNISTNYIKNAKFKKPDSYINKQFENFPKNIEKLLTTELEIIKKDIKNAKSDIDKFNINLKIKNLFMYVFVELLQDYKKYSYIIDDYPVFNSFLMVKEKKKDKNFYEQFSSTQLFLMFIQKSLFNNKETYFQEVLAHYISNKNNGMSTYEIYQKSFEKIKENYSSFFKIEKNYIIRPFFIEEIQNNEENSIFNNKNIPEDKIRQNISNMNDHGILKENKRIIENLIELNNYNDPKNFDAYLFPGQNKENLINETKKSKDVKNNILRLKKTKTSKIGIILDNNSKENKIKYCYSLAKKEYKLTEDEKDEIKDNIREIMTRVYRSEFSRIDEDKKTVLKLIKTKFGREYFISILNTGNIKKRDIKRVDKKSFEFFKVIFISILNLLNMNYNYNIIKYAVKLLKACLYIKNQKDILLSDKLYDELETYPFINYNSFWKTWIEDELTLSDIEILKSKDNKEFHIDGKNEQHKSYLENSYNIMIELTNIMKKMKIKKNDIYSILSQISQDYLISEKQLQDFMEKIEPFK